jgi:hypothetical protein
VLQAEAVSAMQPTARVKIVLRSMFISFFDVAEAYHYSVSRA